MNTVKEIKYNPRCVASITVKISGIDTIKTVNNEQAITVYKN